MSATINSPAEGSKITFENSKLHVPDNPIIPYIEGDGIGADLWVAAHTVFNGAVKHSYGGAREIAWMEIPVGEKANNQFGEYLPQVSLDAIEEYKVSIKGPLTTPVGGGIRSLNVSMRQLLDLYACVRPVKYYEGTPSPVKEPEKLDIVIFRENTEDVYAGIEWAEGTPDAMKVIDFLTSEMGAKIRPDSGIGIKPISITGTYNLVRKAIKYAIDEGRDSVTLVHKGNIMKYTEGAFREWGYELAATEFGDATISEDEVWERYNGAVPEGKILIKDRIADAMFQQVLTRPDEYDVVAMPNLNGDYMSDAAAAQVGGLGIEPGANIGDEVALFEPTHGSAPKYTGKNVINPMAAIAAAQLMLDTIGQTEAAGLMEKAIVEVLGKLQDMGAGKMGYSTSETGDMVAQAVADA